MNSFTTSRRRRQSLRRRFPRLRCNAALSPAARLDLADAENSEEILALDEALCRLEQQEPEVGEVVRLRFFAGLSVDQTAESLGVSPRSVDRRWKFARAWLFREREWHDEG